MKECHHCLTSASFVKKFGLRFSVIDESFERRHHRVGRYVLLFGPRIPTFCRVVVVEYCQSLAKNLPWPGCDSGQRKALFYQLGSHVWFFCFEPAHWSQVGQLTNQLVLTHRNAQWVFEMGKCACVCICNPLQATVTHNTLPFDTSSESLPAVHNFAAKHCGSARVPLLKFSVLVFFFSNFKFYSCWEQSESLI